MSDLITHRGVISNIIGEHIDVEITPRSACSSCSAKSVCNPQGTAVKVISVKEKNSSLYSIGEEVDIFMQKRIGFKAVIISFVIPSIILLSSLAIFTKLGVEEAFSGVFALFLLACYYLALRLFKERWMREFIFTIEKI